MHRSLRSNIHRRRVYSVAGSNSLWHFDGNHKLITFGIVIHGCIDGFSRAVTYVQAATNNRAQTVLDFFLSSTCEWGVPSRVRCDKGGENVLVCAFMECYRGTGRSSAIMGKSVHNCRIERLWVDIWKDVTARYYNLFSYLASERILDLVEPKCVWALHYVFLPRLNRDLKQFQAQWNLHGLRTEHGLCPKALFLESMLNMTGSSHTAVQDFIPPEVDINEEIYGIDEENNNVDEENNSTELSIVNLEDVSCPLDATTLERVKSTINPLENRTGNPNEDDITLYTETLRIIFGNL